MKKYDIGASLVFAGIGVFVLTQCGQWEDYVRGALGPGFWPKILAIFLIIISVVMLLTSLFKKYEEEEEPVIDYRSPAFKQVFKLFFVLALYGIGLYWLGFFVPTILFVILVMFIMGVRNVKILLITSVGIAACIYIVFAQLLNLYLPTARLF